MHYIKLPTHPIGGSGVVGTYNLIIDYKNIYIFHPNY